LAENYKLSVKLPFGIVGLVLAVQPYYTNWKLTVYRLEIQFWLGVSCKKLYSWGDICDSPDLETLNQILPRI